MSRHALSYLAIIGGGTLAGVLLASRLASVTLDVERLTPDAVRGQALAVTVPSRSGVGPSSTAAMRDRDAAVMIHRLPRAVAGAHLASTAGTKGGAPRWQPDVAMRSGEAAPGSRAGSAGSFVSLGAPEPKGAMTADGARQFEDADRAIGRAFYQLAYSQQRQGDAEAAMASYDRAGALNPDHAAIWYNWGLLLQQEGAAEEAIAKYVRAIRADRTHRFAWYNLGWLLQTRGDVESAVRVYERAIAVGATHALTFYNLGYLQQTRGRHALATQLYREAIALDPSHVLSRYNLGYMLQLESDLGAAAEQYRAVLQIEPDHKLARRNLAEIEALLGARLAARSG